MSNKVGKKKKNKQTLKRKAVFSLMALISIDETKILLTCMTHS